MAANIAAIRANVRKDLHDEDSAAYRWTDAVLDRHIGRAALEYSLHAPLEQKTTITPTAGTRTLSTSTLANLVEVVRVEFPAGNYPPSYVGFAFWQGTITMDLAQPAASGQDAAVYWHKLHTLDASSSTVPPMHDDIICAGAAAYAALDWTSFAANRLNTGGDDVWGRYKAFAQERLLYFEHELQRIGVRNTIRQRRLYVSDAPSRFDQSQVSF
jgi:hypothetical protein